VPIGLTQQPFLLGTAEVLLETAEELTATFERYVTLDLTIRPIIHSELMMM
jgi:hypothetical protein